VDNIIPADKKIKYVKKMVIVYSCVNLDEMYRYIEQYCPNWKPRFPQEAVENRLFIIQLLKSIDLGPIFLNCSMKHSLPVTETFLSGFSTLKLSVQSKHNIMDLIYRIVC
jgi:hypothetical protein